MSWGNFTGNQYGYGNNGPCNPSGYYGGPMPGTMGPNQQNSYPQGYPEHFAGNWGTRQPHPGAFNQSGPGPIPPPVNMNVKYKISDALKVRPTMPDRTIFTCLPEEIIKRSNEAIKKYELEQIGPNVTSLESVDVGDIKDIHYMIMCALYFAIDSPLVFLKGEIDKISENEIIIDFTPMPGAKTLDLYLLFVRTIDAIMGEIYGRDEVMANGDQIMRTWLNQNEPWKKSGIYIQDINANVYSFSVQPLHTFQKNLFNKTN